jgi:transcriptional regulator with XRE-family HTH domain
MNGGSRKELVNNIIGDKEFRHFWSETYLRENIPFQMKTMRTERDLRQADAAKLLGKGQNGLSRLESPAYGRLTLQSLLEVAKGYDVGLVVKFVPFSRLLQEYEDVSFNALSAPSPTEKFPEELRAIKKWALKKEDSGVWEKSVAVTYEPGTQKRRRGHTPERHLAAVVGTAAASAQGRLYLPPVLSALQGKTQRKMDIALKFRENLESRKETPFQTELRGLQNSQSQDQEAA